MFVYNGWNTSLGRYYGNQIYQGKHKKHAREHFITHKIRIMIISINWNNVVIHTYDSPIQLCYRTMMQKLRHLNWCSWWVTDTSFLIFQLIDCHIFFTVSFQTMLQWEIFYEFLQGTIFSVLSFYNDKESKVNEESLFDCYYHHLKFVVRWYKK